MIDKIPNNKKITIIFGTTQVDPAYASRLANIIQADKKILVDDFCDRSLACNKYKEQVRYSEIIHLLSQEKKMNEILKRTDDIKVIFGSFYLVGEIMRVSRYMPFATR